MSDEEKSKPYTASFPEYARPIYEAWDKRKFLHDRLKRDTGCNSWMKYLESGMWQTPANLKPKE